MPVRVVPDKSGKKVKAIEYLLTEMIPDKKGGRPRPKAIEGSETVLEIDTLVGAIGQEADYSFIPDEFQQKLTFERGRIVTNEVNQTSDEKVFAGGDSVNKTADAISAIADGYRAVKGIEALLFGK